MSDPSNTQTAPAAWTASKTIATVGSGGSLYLVADWIQACVAAGHIVAPTAGLVVAALTLLAYPAHLIWSIAIGRLQKAAGVAVVALALLPLMGGCANSTPASTSSTIQATCTAISAADASFQAFAKARPGVIDANGMSIEGAIMASVGLTPGGGTPAPNSICAPPYSLYTATAEATVIGAAFQVATLLTSWQK